MLGNNLANAATGGFKGDRELYNLYYGNALGAPASLPVIEGHWTDFSQGLLEETGAPLDFALEGEGFFVVDGPDGPLYTRNGSLRLSADGVLETKEGHPVQVRRPDGTPLRVTSPEPLEIDPKGAIRQAGRTLGQLEIVNFANGSLKKFGNTYFEALPGVAPTPADAKVHQGRIETSNVSTSEAAVRLVNVMRQFETLQRAIKTADEMNGRAVNEVARVGS